MFCNIGLAGVVKIGERARKGCLTTPKTHQTPPIQQYWRHIALDLYQFNHKSDKKVSYLLAHYRINAYLCIVFERMQCFFIRLVV